MRDKYDEGIVFIIFSYFRRGFFFCFCFVFFLSGSEVESAVGTHDILSMLVVQFSYLQKDPCENFALCTNNSVLLYGKLE